MTYIKNIIKNGFSKLKGRTKIIIKQMLAPPFPNEQAIIDKHNILVHDVFIDKAVEAYL